MDLVIHNHHAVQSLGAAASRDLDPHQDVRRAVLSGQLRVAHGPGHDDRAFGGHQRVEQVGGLLDGVHALDYHRASEAVAQCSAFASARPTRSQNESEVPGLFATS